jgi:hypothetical protein
MWKVKEPKKERILQSVFLEDINPNYILIITVFEEYSTRFYIGKI